MTPPLIRPAAERDLPALLSLLGELGHPISPDDMRHNLRAVAASPGDELLVAEEEGQVVGLIGLRMQLVIHRPGHVGEYTALVVRASHRRRGLGQALVRAGEQWFSQRGVTTLRVASHNRRKQEAHRFYTALGYEGTHTMFWKRL